jgi:AraC-like DNA-binding protein
MIQLFLEGSAAGDCEGAYYRAGPGDICIRDLSQPFDSATTPGSTITVVVPRERIDRRLGGRLRHGCVLADGDPLTRLLADFMISLSKIADNLNEADALAVEDSVVELIVAVALRRRASAASPAAGQVLRPRILDFIDQHLFEPALGPGLLIKRFHVSRANLYRIFEADGGVASVIRNRRLDAALRELSGPRRRSITDLSLDLGFSSSSQFARAFRARFNCTPSEVAAGQIALAPTGLDALRRHFADQAA